MHPPTQISKSWPLAIIPLLGLAACGNSTTDRTEQLLAEQTAALSRMSETLSSMSKQSGPTTTVIYPPQPSYPPVAPAAPVFNNAFGGQAPAPAPAEVPPQMVPTYAAPVAVPVPVYAPPPMRYYQVAPTFLRPGYAPAFGYRPRGYYRVGGYYRPY
jgi:hypothetical protein